MGGYYNFMVQGRKEPLIKKAIRYIIIVSDGFLLI